MSDITHEFLIRGTAAAKAGDLDEARNYLERVFNFDPDVEEKIQAWYWLSRVSKDPDEKRKYLENVLAYNLGDARARRDLAILNGEIKEEEIIDPDRYQQKWDESSTSGKRFTCPKCGGRMKYSADGKDLICEYCTYQDLIISENDQENENFIAAMATSKGHAKPLFVYSFKCEGCGAEFILPPEYKTINCPYCASAYVIQSTDSKEIIEPNGIIPFQVNENQAKKALISWFKENEYQGLPRVHPAVGIYIPVWLFDVGGQLSWTYLEETSRNKWVKMNGAKNIFVENIIVPASKRFPECLLEGIEDFDFLKAVPYEERFMVNWPAETYQISLGKASLEARKRTLEEERAKIAGDLFSHVKDLVIDTANMVVQSYQLLMIPVWLTYFDDGKRYDVLINGQSGKVLCRPSDKE